MMQSFFLFLIVVFNFACGVKGPPIAPIRTSEPIPQVLDCSPYDPKCDKTDTKYIPGVNEKSASSEPESTKKKKKNLEE